MDIPALRDEVTHSDYVKACRAIEQCGMALAVADPDEAAEHWLPKLTLNLAVVFSYVGSNMTARHVPQFVATQAALDAAKDGGSQGGSRERRFPPAGPGSTVPNG